jgi:hypothetical protein
MSYPQLDRRRLKFKSLVERKNRVDILRDMVDPESSPRSLSRDVQAAVDETAERILAARAADRPVILTFGAHAIKNGLGSLLVRLIENRWVTHLATNGAGIIHDWEFAFQGRSSEDVRANMERGEFGLWQETGFYINLALIVGAWEGLGYGESVGKLIEREGLHVPDPVRLAEVIRAAEEPARTAAAADCLEAIRAFALQPGWLAVPHPHKEFCVQAAAFRLRVPFTGHPMFGQDIIYAHPLCHGAAIGRTAERDLLAFAEAVSHLEGGVYLSVGSAVMSPMIFEKAFSMAQNLSVQSGAPIRRHFMAVVDLAPAQWDWQRDGEPPQTHPAYYMRFCKTFSRLGGTLRYTAADNRDFLLGLYAALRGRTAA